MRVVFPDPHPPKIPIAKFGGLLAMISVNAWAICVNPMAGCFVGVSRRIFFPVTLIPASVPFRQEVTLVAGWLAVLGVGFFSRIYQMSGKGIC
jgi:hypothetical protein